MITSQPAPVAILAAISLEVMPPRPRPETLPPAMASISGVMAATSGICLADASRDGIGGIKPVHIRQQDQPVRAHHGGDARGQPVIVAEADFRGRHRVVLVDHRHRAQIEQGLQGGAGIEIAVALFGIAEGQQHLRRHQMPTLAKHVGIGFAPAAPALPRPRPGFPPAERPGRQVSADCAPARWSRRTPE